MTFEEDVAGMTVNERLVRFKVVEAFDSAVKAADCEAAVAALLKAHLTKEQAIQTARAVLADPAHYGYRQGHGT